MAFKTRGSASLDKAQRRLALLKSIDNNLDLGHGLTIATYTHLIETTRDTLEAHNTLISNLDESRKTVTQMDKDLANLSERMLTGIASIYGRNSIEYAKAGGSNGRRNKPSTPVDVLATAAATQLTSPATTTALINSNGKASVAS